MSDHSRPTWMEINLGNLAYNCREVRKLVRPETMIMGIVKGNAQGHGAVKAGEVMLKNGIDRFGVAMLSEAVELRKAYKEVPILILGYTPAYQAKEVIENEITQTIYSYESAEAFSRAAAELGKTAIFHIKLDTGMNRIGMKADEESIDEIIKISKLPNIFIEGIFTHFAVADEDRAFTYKQAERFNHVVEELKVRGLKIPIKHVSNSAAIMDMPGLNYDMVRAGRILLGYCLEHEAKKNGIGLKRVMSLYTEICHVKEIEAGEGISYGLRYKAGKRTKVATLPIGYGDGFTGTGRILILVKGHPVKVIGRITMDMTMVDVSGLDAAVGDNVEICPEQWEDFMTLDILMWISPRIPREYI
ncbi:alanine racemase [Lutispora saccharofermentans]|uniref:Alanine racemase n=1 Tax=Lutispora saccharofermentans TaxID=3024236 RepID=A0ABT1NML3_9FIRM|nr:alanine racemase [Lutispora saccharofermentans]MCQ1531531.1 alanine racemase [Lutispora saccharofermentans]